MGRSARPLHWQKSPACGNAACVEWAWDGDHTVLVRDSKDPDGPWLTFSREEWTTFLAGAAAAPANPR